MSLTYPKLQRIRYIGDIIRTLLLASFALGITSWFVEFSEALNTLVTKTFLFAVGLEFLLQTWMPAFLRLEWPYTLEGFPVKPSGIWVQEATPVTIGTPVLVMEGDSDAVYKGKVLRLLSGGWVRVRFLGWSKLWDVDCQLSSLQLDIGDTAASQSDTAIRAGNPRNTAVRAG